MERHKISIIISVYNTEKYLEKCLDSVINQTYQNLEIILVDDCSKDGSLKVIEKYAKKDKRIIVLKNDQNIGLASSRNKALDLATGDYIGFIDSDDYIDKGYYKVLATHIKESDIVVCDINLVYEKGNNLVKCGTKDNQIINIINNGLAASACNKLFKKELFGNMRYPKDIINEDVAVILPLLANAKNVKYTDEVYYNYMQRESSIQNSSIERKRFDIFKTVSLAFQKIKKKEFREVIIFNQIILLLLFVLSKEKKRIKRYKLLKEYSHLAKQYDIANNKYLLEFISLQGFKHQLYYKALVKSTSSGFIFFANFLISFYQFYRNHFTKEVIKENITEKDIEELAKRNASKHSKFKISVVIPNYNYSKFLFQRMYSILNQTCKIHEIILLDDCSKDDSEKTIKILEKIISPYIKMKTVFNEKNSGSAFKQWYKGFKEATGDYVWIAEADDYCNKKLLQFLQKGLTKDIVISYADTSFIDVDGKVYQGSVVKEIDIQHSGHFNKSFVNDGVKELEDYAFLNTTIANVSSCIIRNGDYDFFKEASQYKQVGDWYIYANLMFHGSVKYTYKQLNYYRVHGSNVTSTTKKEQHLKEIQSMHEYLDSKIKFDKHQKKLIQERYKFLKKVWDIE